MKNFASLTSADLPVLHGLGSLYAVSDRIPARKERKSVGVNSFSPSIQWKERVWGTFFIPFFTKGTESVGSLLYDGSKQCGVLADTLICHINHKIDTLRVSVSQG